MIDFHDASIEKPKEGIVVLVEYTGFAYGQNGGLKDAYFMNGQWWGIHDSARIVRWAYIFGEDNQL